MTIPTTEILENFFSGWTVSRLCQHYALSAEVVDAIIRKHGLDRPRGAYSEYVTYPRNTPGKQSR